MSHLHRIVRRTELVGILRRGLKVTSQIVVAAVLVATAVFATEVLGKYLSPTLDLIPVRFRLPVAIAALLLLLWLHRHRKSQKS